MILTKSKINKILEKLVGHRITISHVVNNSGERLKTYGVLREMDDEIITITCFTLYGRKEVYHLNRKACQLYSILDEGLYVKPKEI